jgi:WD40 repeat protein
LARLVAFSPDGRLLASGGYSTDVRVWDVSTARRLYTLKGPSGRAITFSPDGKLLVSAAESVVLLWDVQSGKQQGKLEVPIGSGWIDQLECLAFRPDGKRLVGAGAGAIRRDTGDEKCTVLISWDAGTGKLIEFAKLDKEKIRLWLSADGGTLARLASAKGGKYFLGVRDLANKKEFDVASKEPVDGPDYGVAVALSPDGKVAALGNKLWDVTTGKQLGTLWSAVPEPISYLCFSPDGRFVAAVRGAKKESIGLYQVKTGNVVFAFKASFPPCEVYSLAITRNGQTMASASEDNTVKLWDLDP